MFLMVWSYDLIISISLCKYFGQMEQHLLCGTKAVFIGLPCLEALTNVIFLCSAFFLVDGAICPHTKNSS